MVTLTFVDPDTLELFATPLLHSSVAAAIANGLMVMGYVVRIWDRKGLIM